MVLVTINNKILKWKFFLLTQLFAPKLVKLQNNNKNDFISGPCTPPGGTIFLSEMLILVSSISYLSMVKKAKWFFDEKNSIFQNKKVKLFGPTEIFSIFFR